MINLHVNSNVYTATRLYFKFSNFHDDVIKWKHFPRYWPFVWGIHRSPVNSPHKGQWRGALMFSLICAWINGWVNNRETGNLRQHRANYDVTVMLPSFVPGLYCPDGSIFNPGTHFILQENVPQCQYLGTGVSGYMLFDHSFDWCARSMEKQVSEIPEIRGYYVGQKEHWLNCWDIHNDRYSFANKI